MLEKPCSVGRWPRTATRTEVSFVPSKYGKTRSAVLTRNHLLALAVTLLCLGGCRSSPPAGIALATTTSVANSGLLETLTSRFGAENRMAVRTQLVGSGLALRMLAEGHVDVVISHAPAAEQQAVATHPRWQYRKIMWNDFVFVGPREDPARVAGTPDLVEAVRRIASSDATFLSRGDLSGTHEREEQLWARAGVRPQPKRLVVAGTGMGTTLRAASRMGAYTLTDRATFAQLAPSLELRIVFEGDPQLLNTYAVVHDPDGPHGRAAAAFTAWLSEGEGRQEIERFTVGGMRGFNVWPVGRARATPSDLPF